MINLKSMKKPMLLFLLIFMSIMNAQNNITAALEVNEFNKIKYILAIDYADNSTMNHVFIEKKEELLLQVKSKKLQILQTGHM